MNKLLIALVLAVGLSGNVYSKAYIHCSIEEDIGFIINVNGNDSTYVLRDSGSEVFVEKKFATFKVEPEVIRFQIYDYYMADWYTINRKTLDIRKGTPTYSYGNCSLAKNKPDLLDILRKKYYEKLKGNKF